MKKVVIFGAGSYWNKFLCKKILGKYSVIAILDNDKNKQGTKFCFGNYYIPIESPEYIFNISGYEAVIISLGFSMTKYSAVCQMSKLGVPDEKIYLWENNRLVHYPHILGDKQNKMDSPRILFDVSQISQNDNQTGIQRVVNNIYKNIQDMGENIVPVRLFGKLITSRSYECRILEKEYDGNEYNIEWSKNDYMLLTDSSWGDVKIFLPQAQDNGVEITSVLYDLMPILHPNVVSPEVAERYREWLHLILEKSNKILCISKTVADDLITYCAHKDIGRTWPLEIYYFHLGFDLQKKEGFIRADMQDFVAGTNTFLMVGTVEKKKNYPLALRAFCNVLKKFPNANLLMIGHELLGEPGDAVVADLLAQDDDLRKHVMWLKDASDAELQWAYQHCAALLYTSTREGFGLPIVEAAYFGLPILCCDVPVFREIAGEYATYFQPDVDDVERVLRLWLEGKIHLDSRKIPLYSWKESAQEIVEILHNKRVPYKNIYSI